MAVESNHSSLAWDSNNSPLQFQSSSLSNFPSYYDRSLVAPLTLSQRKCNSHPTILQLPPVKLCSTLTWRSSEGKNLVVQSTTTSENELMMFKQKYDRLRASLSVRFFFDYFLEQNLSIQIRLSRKRYVCLEIAWLLLSQFIFLRKLAFFKFLLQLLI
jgi:hypothetical protein